MKEKAENISEQIKSASEGDVVNARNEAEFAFWEAAKKAAELVKDSLEAKDAQVSKHPAHPEGEKVLEVALSILEIAFSE